MMYPRYATAVDAIDLLQLQHPGRRVSLLKIRILNAGGNAVAALPTALENAIVAALQASVGDDALVMFALADLVVVAMADDAADIRASAVRLLAIFEQPIQVHNRPCQINVEAGLVIGNGLRQSGEVLLGKAIELPLSVAAPSPCIV